MQTQYQPDYEAEQPHDDVELDVEDAFGEHDIEYWVRRGNKLVPATDAEVAQIHEWEREAVAQVRLARWKRTEAQSRSWAARLLRAAPLRYIMWVRRTLGRGHQPAGVGGSQERQHTGTPVEPSAPRGYDQRETGTAT